MSVCLVEYFINAIVILYKYFVFKMMNNLHKTFVLSSIFSSLYRYRYTCTYYVCMWVLGYNKYLQYKLMYLKKNSFFWRNVVAFCQSSYSRRTTIKTKWFFINLFWPFSTILFSVFNNTNLFRNLKTSKLINLVFMYKY